MEWTTKTQQIFDSEQGKDRILYTLGLVGEVETGSDRDTAEQNQDEHHTGGISKQDTRDTNKQSKIGNNENTKPNRDKSQPYKVQENTGKARNNKIPGENQRNQNFKNTTQ